MLTYTFAKGSGESLYEQLYDRIKADILTGRLAAGEKLPSKRTLADHLELSVITVKNAYEQLIAEGYIYSRERSGYFVSAMDWPLSAAAAAPQKISQLPPRPTWFLDFASGSPEPDDFPFTVWSRLMRQTILEQGTRLLEPTPYNAAGGEGDGPAGRGGAAPRHRGVPAPVPRHDGGSGADHRRRGHGVSL